MGKRIGRRGSLFHLQRRRRWRCCIIVYGFAASALPVWLLLAPRDYLSTFVKLGTIAVLALGIVASLPALHMPALTRFIDGTGPVFAGKVFPFASSPLPAERSAAFIR